MTMDFSRLKILVVDDQMLVRSLLTQSLKAMGVQPDHIYQAVDGATAKRALDGKPVDIVLCDLQMEPMNGMDLLKEIRCGRTMNPPNMPFVFLSGYAEKHNIVLAAQLHADGFVIKPPKPAELEKNISAAMARARPEPDPFAYYTIPTGSAHDKFVFGEQLQAAARKMDEDGHPVETLALKEVKAGRILGEDLYNKTGQLLLQRGSELTITQLRVLVNYPDRFGVQKVVLRKDDPVEA
ncbi:response regulator [Vogesella sp. DC21W]|uniref:Response regulator n=1 Tax=Vogesella aquatica TaxID=2984206 RepID=A0ABT5J044_9NEIS|nr:response regulator [Vogesella aquatica]MDC7717768.1 response regulator [Vogesella aquatica]